MAAPRFLGRNELAHTLHRYAQEGAWGISPHVIPHHTLHAASGTLSLALKMHGPNFGVDACPGTESQALLAAVSLLSQDRVPGVWLVFSGWSPEPVPQTPQAPAANSQPAETPVCRALALALTPPRPGPTGLRLTVMPGTVAHQEKDTNGLAGTRTLFSLEGLLDVLAGERPAPAPITWRMNCGGWATLEQSGNGGEN